ncbi:MAG: S1 RNA-binding domain-containing protein, partial [bacterium]
ALRATGAGDIETARPIAAEVARDLAALGRPTVEVEDVQDLVERVLIRRGLGDAAKAYILHRQRHADVRRTKAMLGVEDDLKLTVNAAKVLQRRYLLRDENGRVVETPAQLFRRVAKAVAEVDGRYGESAGAEEEFYRMLSRLAFLPNSPTLMNAGTDLGQLAACFVLPVPDSVEGIFDAVKHMALIHQSGGGTGFDFSRLRPRGDVVRSTGGIASGPVSFMKVFDSTTDVIRQGGRRRGANMAILRVDHPDIFDFIGAKSEGVDTNRELFGRHAKSKPALAIGDVDLVYVLQPESQEGHAVLSLRRAGLERKWRSMQEQFETGAIIEAPVIDHNKGGLIVDCGIRGFVPISQIVDFPRRPQNDQPRDAAQEIAEKLQPYVGRKLRLKILEVNRKANRLILSEKVALYEERREKRDELFSSLQVGQKVSGTVRSIAPFGVFIDLGGIDGLVHKSELSWNKVNNPEAGYKVGETVEAEVIDINHERGRISLSIRRLQPDPWHSTVADFKVGDIIEGTVTKLVNFGAFVRVRDGLEGLIHISELSHQRVAHPGDVVREGQTLKLKIISLDSERHRLGLSLKQAEEPPPRPAPDATPRPRRARDDRGYSMADAVQEPEGGIDNTLASAFAQVRQALAANEVADEAVTIAVVAEVVAEEAEDTAESAAAVAEVADDVA